MQQAIHILWSVNHDKSGYESHDSNYAGTEKNLPGITLANLASGNGKTCVQTASDNDSSWTNLGFSELLFLADKIWANSSQILPDNNDGLKSQFHDGLQDTTNIACCSKPTSQYILLTPDNAIRAESEQIASVQINIEEKHPRGEEKNVPDKMLDNIGTLPNRELCDPIVEFAAVSTPLKENHSPDNSSSHDIDLTISPQQKSRRIQMSASQKPAQSKETPCLDHDLNTSMKQATKNDMLISQDSHAPSTSCSRRNPLWAKPEEHPTAKRKYVRRKSLNNTSKRNPPEAKAMAKENAIGKRNHVRRKGLNKSSTKFSRTLLVASKILKMSLNEHISKDNNDGLKSKYLGDLQDTSYIACCSKETSQDTQLTPENAIRGESKEIASMQINAPCGEEENVSAKKLDDNGTPPNKEMMTESSKTSCGRALDIGIGARDESFAGIENATVHPSNEIDVAVQETNVGLAYDLKTSTEQASNNMSLPEDTQAPSTSSKSNPPPEAVTKENATTKRKYVRRKRLNKFTPPTETTATLTEPMVPDSTKMSRRSSAQSNSPGAKLNANSVGNRNRINDQETAQDGHETSTKFLLKSVRQSNKNDPNISNSQISMIRLQMLGSKRKPRFADTSSMNKIGANHNGFTSYQNMFMVQFPNLQKRRKSEKGKSSNASITSSVITVKDAEPTFPQEVAQAHPYASSSSCRNFGFEYNAARVPTINEATGSIIDDAQAFEEFKLSSRRAQICDCESLTRIRNFETDPNYSAHQLCISDRRTFGDAERPQTSIDALVKETIASLTKKKRTKNKRVVSSSSYSTINEMQQSQNFALGNYHQSLGKPLDIACEVKRAIRQNVIALSEQFSRLEIYKEARDQALREHKTLGPYKKGRSNIKI